MKKKWLVALLCFACVASVSFAVSACNAESNHEHTYAAEWSKDETNHWHAATCEHTDETSGLAAHTWDDGEVTTAPTEEQDGVKTYTCTVCGWTKTEPVAKLEHSHTYSEEWSYDGNNHWHAATCEHTDETSGLAAHTWDDGVVTTAPTEEQDGVKTYTCTVCGQTKTEPVAKLEHSHTYSEEWSYDGNNHWHAATCGHADETSGLAAHTWDDGEVTTSPTCEVDGERTFKCIVCNATRTEVIPAIEHDWGEWTVKTPATCGEAGEEQRVCANDPTHIDKREISVTEHSWGEWTVTVIPTEETVGQATRICKNDDEHTDSVTLPTLTDEGYAKSADTATCEDAGYITYSITVDGEEFSFDVTTPARHSYEWVVTKAPTTSAAGTASHVCSVCEAHDAESADITLGVLSNASVDNGTYVRQTMVEATCTAQGLDVYKTAVGKVPDTQFTFEVVTSATGHTYELQGTDPVADGGTVISACVAGDDSAIYNYDAGITVTASNTTATPNVLQDGNVYFVKADVSSVKNTYSSFTVTEDMVKEQGYEINFVQFTTMSAGITLVAMTVGSTTVASNGRFNSSFVQLTTTKSTSEFNVNFVANSANVLRITFYFTEDHIGQEVVFCIRATAGTSFGITENYYLMGLGCEVLAQDVESNRIVYGGNNVKITESYMMPEYSSDRYVYIPTESGVQGMTIPAGITVFIVRNNEDGTVDYIEFLDYFTNKTEGNFDVTEGVGIEFVFASDTVGSFTVTIGEAFEVKEMIISLDEPLTDVILYYGTTSEIKVADDLEAGEYTLTISGGAMLFRSQIGVTVNGVTYNYAVLGNADDFAKIITLNPGDVITVSMLTRNDLGDLTFSLTPVSEENNTLGLGEEGAYTATFNSANFKIYPVLDEAVENGNYKVMVEVVDGTLAYENEVYIIVNGEWITATSDTLYTVEVEIDLSEDFYIQCYQSEEVTLKITLEAVTE